MGMPRVLKIGPYSIKIIRERKRVLQFVKEHEEVPNPDKCNLAPEVERPWRVQGLYLGSEIYVDKDLSFIASKEVLLHEVLHACWALVGLHEGGRVAAEEERVISPLSQVLLDVLRRNPHFVDFLME